MEKDASRGIGKGKEATAANRERVAQLDEKRKKSDAKKNDRLAEMGVLRR